MADVDAFAALVSEPYRSLVDRLADFAEAHPWTGIADAYNYAGHETLLADLRAAARPTSERPAVCRKCGLSALEHPWGVCTSPEDPNHTTGLPDYPTEE